MKQVLYYLKIIMLILIIVSFSTMIYWHLMTPKKEGLCYNKGATVIDPSECCGGAVPSPDAIIYQQLYICKAAAKKVDPEYDRINQCYNNPAVRADKSDCCKGGNLNTTDISLNGLPMYYCK